MRRGGRASEGWYRGMLTRPVNGHRWKDFKRGTNAYSFMKGWFGLTQNRLNGKRQAGTTWREKNLEYFINVCASITCSYCITVTCHDWQIEIIQATLSHIKKIIKNLYYLEHIKFTIGLLGIVLGQFWFIIAWRLCNFLVPVQDWFLTCECENKVRVLNFVLLAKGETYKKNLGVYVQPWTFWSLDWISLSVLKLRAISLILQHLILENPVTYTHTHTHT